MTIIATILNIFLLIFVIFTFSVTESINGAFRWTLALVLAAPITNLIALFMKNDEGLFRLYLRRKALEEKKKIQNLEAPSITNTKI